MRRPGLASVCIAALVLLLSYAATALRAQNQQNAPQVDPTRLAEATTTFAAVCASCHGLDARGGERGPDIATRPEVVRKTDAELMTVLKDGKVSSGMPSFASYGPEKLAALVAYLRELQGSGKKAPLPGDPSRGRTLFFGKARCSECHMVAGKGGFFGQDLTAYAGRMKAADVRNGIVNPNKDMDPRRGVVNVTLADSSTLTGLARNEDNFSLQLQTPDGAFHLLNKADIRTITRTGKSPMPTDDGSLLPSSELDDLVSFLVKAASSGSAKAPGYDYDDDDE